MLDTRQHDLRRAHLRVTPGRLAILAALGRHPHSTADALHRLVKDARPSLSLQSVYNVLGDLDEAGLVRRIEPAGSAALYELSVDDNHHHIVCTNCSAVADVECIHGEAPCLEPRDASGYLVSAAEVTFWGICPDCQHLQDDANQKEKK